MKRKEFIQQLGKGIAAYSVLPLGANLPMLKNTFDEKTGKTEGSRMDNATAFVKKSQNNNKNDVVPIDWSRFTAGPPNDAASLRIKDILLNSVKYNFTVWYNGQYGAQKGEYLNLDGVRPPACAALALATAVKFGIYDASVVGISEKEAVDRAVKLTKSAAHSHRANTPKGWGDDWQTAMWANLVGSVAWLMWNDFSPTDQQYARNMVEYEANRFLTFQVPYYMDERGNLIYPGNTQAEGNAWNSGLLQLATSMMPNHVNWNAWMDKNIEIMIAAYARPQDLTNTETLHGRQVKDWLNGSNAYNDGIVVNHSIIHPDYMTSIGQVINAPFPYTLAGMATPKASLFNADHEYKALVDLNFRNPPFDAPGGTIYIDNSPDIYYPQGNDWGTRRRMNFAMLDVYADAFGLDNLVKKKGAYWEKYHAQMVLDMQNRHQDGRTYSGRSEDTNPGREQWVALLASRAYQAKWLRHQHKVTFTNKPYTCLLSGTWRERSIGGVAGLCRYSGNILKVQSAGHITGISDQVKYVYRQVKDDATIIARLNSLESPDKGATAGITYRSSLHQSAANVYIGCILSGEIIISYRDRKGLSAYTQVTKSAGHNIPVWLKLEKRKNMLTGYYSYNGAEWNAITKRPILINNFLKAGSMGVLTAPNLINTSQDRRTIRYRRYYKPSQISQAVFDHIQIHNH